MFLFYLLVNHMLIISEQLWYNCLKTISNTHILFKLFFYSTVYRSHCIRFQQNCITCAEITIDAEVGYTMAFRALCAHPHFYCGSICVHCQVVKYKTITKKFVDCQTFFSRIFQISQKSKAFGYNVYFIQTNRQKPRQAQYIVRSNCVRNMQI